MPAPDTIEESKMSNFSSYESSRFASREPGPPTFRKKNMKGSKGLDTPYSLEGRAHDLVAQGFGFVGRYTSPNSPTFAHKHLSAEEVRGFQSVGLRILCIWEKGTQTSVRYFTAARGSADGRDHAASVKALGAPLGTCLYFAIDYDSSSEENRGPIEQYARAYQQAVKDAGYLAGAYGNGDALDHLFNSGIIHYRWLAWAPGWNGSRHYLGADIVQGPTFQFEGIDCDSNAQATDNAGLW